MIISWQCLPLLLSTPLWDFRMIRTAGPSSGGTCRGGSLRATWEWNSILQQTTGLVMLVLVPLVYQKNSRYYILKYFTEPMPKLETYFWEMAHWVRYNRMTIPNCWKDELKLHLCQTVYLPDFKKLHHIEWYGSGSICTLQTEIPLTIVHHCPMRE